MAHENFYHISLSITFVWDIFTKKSKTRKRFSISQITISVIFSI